ncbi:MAG: CoA transferase [Cumulibacter sp.]
MTALDDLKVLDLSTGVAPALMTMMLADFGADVLRVEHADGTRAAKREDPGYAMWDRNKRLSLLNPDVAADRQQLAALIAASDIVVTQRTGEEVVSAAELSQLLEDNPNPARIVVVQPAYADFCPWASGRESNELTAAAIGMSLRQSSATTGPIDPVYRHVIYVQGIWGATSALAAVHHRALTGLGQTVTVGGAHAGAIAGCATSVVDPDNIVVAPAAGNGGPNATYSPYQCSDGEWLFVGALTPKFQFPMFEMLGLDIPTDPRINGDMDALLLLENRDWVRAEIAAVYATKPRDHWLAELHRRGVPAGPVQERDRWLDHEQVQAIGMRAEIDDPHRGRVVMPAVPINLADTPGSVRTPAPTRADAVDAVEWVASDVDTTGGNAGTGDDGPLTGLRVLDLGTVLAGPLTGSLLAELGADVVKVEPLEGDSFRVKGFMYNRGMRSLAINLRDEAAREAFYDLVRHSDVVVDNFRPGVLARLGIDYDTLSAINDQIITLSFTGYGHAGPLQAEPGFDPVLQAMSGMMRAQGGDGDPVFLTMAVNDICSAVIGTFATTVALHHRSRAAHGQQITGSLAATSVFMQSGEITRFEGRPRPRRGGAEYQGPSELDRLYATAGDGWIRLQATEAQRGVLSELGLTGDLGAAFATRDRDEVLESLTAAGIDVVGAYHPNELIEHKNLRDSELIQQQSRPNGRPFFATGRLVRFSQTERSDVMGPPGLGQHSVEILRSVGIEKPRIDALLSSGSVVTGEPMPLDKFVSYR